MRFFPFFLCVELIAEGDPRQYSGGKQKAMAYRHRAGAAGAASGGTREQQRRASASASAGASGYQRVKVIGKGAFGAAILVRKGADLFVRKEVPLSGMSNKEKLEAEHEAAVLKDLSHKNIIHYVDSGVSHGKLWIVMAYASGGDLDVYVQKKKRARCPHVPVLLLTETVACAVLCVCVCVCVCVLCACFVRALCVLCACFVSALCKCIWMLNWLTEPTAFLGCGETGCASSWTRPWVSLLSAASL